MPFGRKDSQVKQGYIAAFAVKEEEKDRVQRHPTVQHLSKI